MNKDYALVVPPTAKDKIPQPKIAKEGVLPTLHFSMILNGSSGSGKSVLAFNLISKFYKNFFDMVILISPTAKTDDIQKALDLPKNRTITDMAKAEAAMQKIEDVQEETIKKDGFEAAKKILVYFDDVVGDPIFMKSKAMINAFIKNRHYGISCILCTQYYALVPKRIRMQAACSFYFACAETELETIAEDHLPPGVPKKQFLKVLQSILSEEYAFVTYNKRSSWPERWRKGLAHVIDFGVAIDTNINETRPAKKLKVIEK
jgi:hypothetical protein